MGLAVIRIKEENKEKILPQYLLAVLQAPNLEKFFIDSSLSEDVMENLRVDHLKEIPIPIVSLAEQEKIKKISDVCLVNPSKSETKDKKDIEVSFLSMEDIEEYSLYVYPQQTKKIEEVYRGYTYFQENDLLIAKITPCFENGKMSIVKNLVNGIEEGKSVMTGSVGHQRISADFIDIYPIPIPSLEIQKELISELKCDEKDKENQKEFIHHQEKKKERFLKSL
ncbi:9080_t:CDS:2 [Ambispora gerdemannii]|uniref:9080_t:CDS:1 n=1 Tax=Ambispora gerdemannii TaxID=144530 RepID=A0A9N8YUZ9_9GLOM|nr:9080_t:CDS:2 [Ambispora gerdemannii]